MNGSSTQDMTQRHAGGVEIDDAPGRSPPPQVKPTRSLHILCIDDDLRVRELMNSCLTHYKHRVMLASGGKQGLELFRTATLENQPYEVVITDFGMPDIDGRRVARTIKAESPNTPIIMMTGWGAMMKAEGETEPAADVVVNKPPHMAELNDLLLRMAAPAASCT
ncbi:MAG: response regulator [Limisphaerales bacterium]